MANLLHIKGSRTKILKTLPSNTTGNDGDIILSAIQGRGVYLCSKVNGKWYVANKLEELRKIEKTSIKDLELNRLKIKNTTLTPNEYDVAVGDLTLDVAGDIEVNADGGQVTIKDGSASHFLFDCDSTQFAIYDDTDVADFFTITVGASGITTLATVDAGAAVGHLTLDPDGELNLTPVTEVKSDAPLKIKEASNAVADTAAYGQLWVKTATPNQLYFTTDAGNDIQLTSGTAAAFVGDITSVTAGTNCSGGGSSGDVTINVDDSFITNDADDTMAGTLIIDKDVSNTSAGAYFGLDIDYQKTGTSTSDNTMFGLMIDMGNTTATNGTNTMYGIWNRTRLTHAADAGTTTVVGTYNAVLGGTNGTATAIGTDIVVIGADTNIGLRINNPDGGNDFQILSSANTSDYFQIATTTEGATTISTVDADTAVAHLALAPDGDLIVDAAGDITLDAGTTDITLKSAGNSFALFDTGPGKSRMFIYESAGGSTDDYFYIDVRSAGLTSLGTIDAAGADAHLTLVSDGNLVLDPVSQNVIINTTDKLNFDGAAGTGTYITESADGIMDFYCDGNQMMSLVEDGNDDKISFITNAVGFTQGTVTYNATDTNVFFSRAGNKQFLTFGSGSETIVDIHFFFPDISCNCVLLIKQHSGGSGAVTNWKTFDHDGGNESTVVWPAATAPTLTTGANKIDILSFYWDNDNHKAYGVATLNF